jgi:hypothetical protein
MIHHSPLPDVEIPGLPLTEYVLAGGAGQPDKPALIDGGSGRVMTYGGLAAAGFGRGDVLALMAPNGPEYAVVCRLPADEDTSTGTECNNFRLSRVEHRFAIMALRRRLSPVGPHLRDGRPGTAPSATARARLAWAHRRN